MWKYALRRARSVAMRARSVAIYRASYFLFPKMFVSPKQKMCVCHILIEFHEVPAKRNLLSPCQFKNKIIFEMLKEIKKIGV